MPEPYLTAARLAGVDPADCLAIEDSNTGARSAEAAGCTVLVVPNHVPVYRPSVACSATPCSPLPRRCRPVPASLGHGSLPGGRQPRVLSTPDLLDGFRGEVAAERPAGGGDGRARGRARGVPALHAPGGRRCGGPAGGDRCRRRGGRPRSRAPVASSSPAARRRALLRHGPPTTRTPSGTWSPPAYAVRRVLGRRDDHEGDRPPRRSRRQIGALEVVQDLEGCPRSHWSRGLGLVPFTSDVHAAQAGTLSRAVAIVDNGLVPRSVAIDEDTVVVDDGLRVLGTRSVWFSEQDGGTVRLTRRSAGASTSPAGELLAVRAARPSCAACAADALPRLRCDGRADGAPPEDARRRA